MGLGKMGRRGQCAVLAAWLCVAAATGQSAAADAATDAQLAAGEILVTTRAIAGSELPEATVQAVIDAPPVAVWKIVDDCANYKRNMMRIAESKLLSRTGAVSVCEVTVDMPMPMRNMTSVNEATATVGPPQWKRAWKLLRGDYKRNEGSWTLTAFDTAGTRTRVVYKIWAEPNISVPNFLIRKAQLSALPDMIKKLRSTLGAK